MTTMQDNAAETTALARREPEEALAIMPVLTIDQAIGRYNAIVDFAKRVMREGRDYGTIPGTGRSRKRQGDGDDVPDSSNNTLLKPGAEKLCSLFGLVPDFEDYRVVEDWDRGFFYYAYKCVLRRGGRAVGSGIGSCNSREKKYRRTSRVCPECGASTIKRSKYPPKNRSSEPPGWFCESRSGGCGRSFAADDDRVVDQQAVIDPDEACDLVNTLQKMAQKRALVAATLVATNASEFFTQDVEDMETIGGAGEVIDGELADEPGRVDVADDDVFRTEWVARLGRRGLSEAEATRRLDQVLAFYKVALDEVNVPGRWELLQKADQGKFDKKQRPAPAEPADPPQQPAQQSDVAGEKGEDVSTWAKFHVALAEEAEEQQVDAEQFKKAVDKALVAIGAKGKEEGTTEVWRLGILRAARAKLFDWKTGKRIEARRETPEAAIA